jgi:hypothetical protein
MPFQRVPVTSRAIAFRDRYRRDSNSNPSFRTFTTMCRLPTRRVSSAPGAGNCNPSTAVFDRRCRNLVEARTPLVPAHGDLDRSRFRRLAGAPVRSDRLRRWPVDGKRCAEAGTACSKISILQEQVPDSAAGARRLSTVAACRSLQ